MDADLTLELIKATVQIDQPLADGKRMVGTGFLVSVPRGYNSANNPPEIVLVTAAHVFEKMPSNEVRIGWRFEGATGKWQYGPSKLTIRSDRGPLWVQHGKEDVAVIPVEVPAAYKDNVVPVAWLADEKTFTEYHIGPGDEMMTLGYPHGLSANPAGFPILRAGRVASYPLTPSTNYPTFLIDLTAIPGNSGGPVFMTDRTIRHPGTEQPSLTFIAGILTKQVEQDNRRLELGLVTHAVFVRSTIDKLLKSQDEEALRQRLVVRPVSSGPPKTPDNSTGDIVPDPTRPTNSGAKPSGVKTSKP
ncbi:trypsin-like serine peptidase [Asticcacaulis endophyticus]|jgi:hypothetical protein|uniref:Serine protease n=1 Tax=Asticcacaulis endophyticus TaxID=1395890 RepID=A0A918Q8R3_9CAUL|nr:serine protease [Asticcacaulis endophyticus]GGZ37413.1 serine protease [Asticcacaulis endophyticus]